MERTGRNAHGAVIAIGIFLLLLVAQPPATPAASDGAITCGRRGVTAGGRTFSVNIVSARLASARIRVGLAGDRVGNTESLAQIADRYGAVAAINGTFFDAYTSHAIKNPHHTLITGGEFVHLGGVGSILGISSSGEAGIERMRFTIEGSINGSWSYPRRWFAYWLNRYPTADTITIFTPRWCAPSTPDGGIQVVVEHGRVTRIANGAQAIPGDGFVIYFLNTYSQLHQKFTVGDQVEYRVVHKSPQSSPFRDSIAEGLEAGPQLVRDGAVALDPVAEGFSSPKILSLSGARSAAGITEDGRLLLVTTAGTVRQLAEIMKALGCAYAMNLDGGASSGLWYRGRYVTSPGRKLSNALLVLAGSSAYARDLTHLFEEARSQLSFGRPEPSRRASSRCRTRKAPFVQPNPSWFP